jgi:hypothetical protein
MKTEKPKKLKSRWKPGNERYPKTDPFLDNLRHARHDLEHGWRHGARVYVRSKS